MLNLFIWTAEYINRPATWCWLTRRRFKKMDRKSQLHSKLLPLLWLGLAFLSLSCSIAAAWTCIPCSADGRESARFWQTKPFSVCISNERLNDQQNPFGAEVHEAQPDTEDADTDYDDGDPDIYAEDLQPKIR
jgi:hypothetical protein